ncbi:hypothetical protein JHK86_051230 [Glycine max]|nr:hypothetical protein JHK86_051230 [Glycine max]
MLDTLEEVDGHFRKLDKKRLDQEMDGICKRIGECAHKLLPMDDYDEEDHKSSEILHSSSTQHNNHLLLERYCMLRQQRSVCLLSLLVFPEHAIIKNLSTIYWWIGESYVENTEDKTAEEVGEDVIDELLKLNLIVPYGNAKYPLVNKFQIHPHILPLLESSDLYEKRQLHLGYYLQQSMLACLVLEQQKVIQVDGVSSILDDYLILTVFNVGVTNLNFGSQWLDKNMKDFICAPTWSLARFTFPSH